MRSADVRMREAERVGDLERLELERRRAGVPRTPDEEAERLLAEVEWPATHRGLVCLWEDGAGERLWVELQPERLRRALAGRIQEVMAEDGCDPTTAAERVAQDGEVGALAEETALGRSDQPEAVYAWAEDCEDLEELLALERVLGVDRVPADPLRELGLRSDFGSNLWGEVVATPAGDVLAVDDGQCWSFFADPEEWRGELRERAMHWARYCLAWGRADDEDLRGARAGSYDEACQNVRADYCTIDNADLADAPDAVQLAVVELVGRPQHLEAARDAIVRHYPRGHRLREESGEAMRRAARGGRA